MLSPTRKPWILVAVLGVVMIFCSSSAGAAADTVSTPELDSGAAAPPKAYTRSAEPLLGYHQQLIFGYVETSRMLTRVQLQFGRTKAYGRHADEFEHPYGYNGGDDVEVEGVAGRLRPDTTYHDRLVAWNERGMSFGTNRPFHTPARKQRSGAVSHSTIQPPDAETGPAEVQRNHVVSLEVILYPKGHYAWYWFQWGTTRRYGRITEPQTDEGQGVFGPETTAEFLCHFRPHTTYHYRLVAKNHAGKGYGRDRTFRTRRHYSSNSCL